MELIEKKTEKPSEVLEKPYRRKYSREYKERMIAAADQLTELGQLGELCRREGLYSGAITRWRKELQGSKVDKNQKRPAKPSISQENARLKRENECLKEKLRQAELIIEVQKKVSEMMQTKSPERND